MSFAPRIVPNMTLETLSPSRAGDFKACPQLFRFRAIDHLPEPTSPQQARGTAAHLALQRFYELDRESRSPERLYDLFRQAWGRFGSMRSSPVFSAAQDEEREWGIASLGLLANYFQLENPESFDPLERELDLLEPIGDGMMIRGILDRVDRPPDGRIVITDYKTGTAPPETYSIPAFFALKIYALLIRRHSARPPPKSGFSISTGPRCTDSRSTTANSTPWSANSAPSGRPSTGRSSGIISLLAPGPFAIGARSRSVCPAWENVDRSRWVGR